MICAVSSPTRCIRVAPTPSPTPTLRRAASPRAPGPGGITTFYTNNNAGTLTSLGYSDNTSILNDFGRLGRRISSFVYTNTTLLSSNAWTYDLTGQVITENQNGLTVANTYDSLNRRTNLTINTQPSSIKFGYGYDGASRLQIVASSQDTATYSYLANSPLVGQIAFSHSGTPRMTTTKQFDNLNRLTRIGSVSSAGAVVDFQYGYNAANQRTNVILAPDNSHWDYAYDSLGQVTSGKKHWPDGSVVAGQQFEYQFDSIGNRKQTKAGGDNSGQNLRAANYTNNLLNQITGRDVPGAADILGIAHASATVTVNGQSTSRKGEYYWKGLGTSNQLAAIYQGVTNTAYMAGTTNTTTGSLLLPMSPQPFFYDADGNLLSDGVWTNTWDAENRLIATETTTAVPQTARAKEIWSYYPDGRWAERVIYAWTNSAWTAQITQHFIWDGNVIVAILDVNLTL